VSPFGDKITDLGDALVDAVKAQSIDNAPMLIFGVVGAILFLFMLKT
jgi:hypothetical protein